MNNPLYRNFIPSKDRHPIVSWMNYAEKIGFDVRGQVNATLEVELAKGRTLLAMELWKKRQQFHKKMKKQRDKCREEIENHRAMIAEEFRQHRLDFSRHQNVKAARRLTLLDTQIQIRQDEIKSLTEQCAGLKLRINQNENLWPSVPTTPTYLPTDKGDNMPPEAGIYFIWNNSVVEYVGKSINLNNRVRLSHEKIQNHHSVSFVLIDEGNLTYAESYYIGILKPKFNKATPCL